MNNEKISKNLSIDCENEELSLKTGTGSEKLSRFEAIKLRNYLNKFINGDLEEEHNIEDSDTLSKL